MKIMLLAVVPLLAVSLARAEDKGKSADAPSGAKAEIQAERKAFHEEMKQERKEFREKQHEKRKAHREKMKTMRQKAKAEHQEKKAAEAAAPAPAAK